MNLRTGMAPKLDFSNVSVPGAPVAPAKPTSSAHPLVFPTSAPPAPLPVSSPMPSAPPKKALDFSGISAPAPKPPTGAAPAIAFVEPGTASPTMVGEASVYAQTMFPDIYKANNLKIDAQIKQLLPFTYDKVEEFADKHIKLNATQTATSTRLCLQIAQAKVQELLDNALKSLTEGPGMLERLLSRDIVAQYEPRLAAVRVNMARWVADVRSAKTEVDTTREKIHIALASFTAAVKYVGDLSHDTSLEIAVSSKHAMLQQVAQQTVFNFTQLQGQLDQLYTLKATLDQLLDVTIPAYKAAKK